MFLQIHPAIRTYTYPQKNQFKNQILFSKTHLYLACVSTLWLLNFQFEEKKKDKYIREFDLQYSKHSLSKKKSRKFNFSLKHFFFNFRPKMTRGSFNSLSKLYSKTTLKHMYILSVRFRNDQ